MLGQDRREVSLESHAVLVIVVIMLPKSQVTTTRPPILLRSHAAL
jgi:hypothetical protein